MRRVLLLVTAVLAVPASAEAGTLLSVPAAGGRPTVVGRDATAYFNPPCWRADGSIIARLERVKSRPRYGVFRALRAVELLAYYRRYTELIASSRFSLAVMSSHSNPHGIGVNAAARSTTALPRSSSRWRTATCNGLSPVNGGLPLRQQ